MLTDTVLRIGKHRKCITNLYRMKLWDDFVKEFDKIELEDEKGKVYSHKTNIANSIYTVWLHYESDGSIPHLHAAVCRKDSDGKTNNDHNIHIRAQDAAQAVAIRRGWTTASEIHRINADKVADDLMDILRVMPSWLWNDYAARIRTKGYTIMIRPGKKGVYGYSIGKGKATFKASELGTGRKLTASRIEDTWNRPQSAHDEGEPAGQEIRYKACCACCIKACCIS